MNNPTILELLCIMKAVAMGYRPSPSIEFLSGPEPIYCDDPLEHQKAIQEQVERYCAAREKIVLVLEVCNADSTHNKARRL